jgi:hypothetical protein
VHENEGAGRWRPSRGAGGYNATLVPVTSIATEWRPRRIARAPAVVQSGVLFDFARRGTVRAGSYPQGFPQNV